MLLHIEGLGKPWDELKQGAVWRFMEAYLVPSHRLEPPARKLSNPEPQTSVLALNLADFEPCMLFSRARAQALKALADVENGVQAKKQRKLSQSKYGRAHPKISTRAIWRFSRLAPGTQTLLNPDG